MTYADGHLAREPAATALTDGRAIDLTSATQRVDELRAEYQAAQPWPHLVLHGLFPDSMLTAAKREAMQMSASELKRDANRAQVKDETTHLPGPVSEELFRFLRRSGVHGPARGRHRGQGPTARPDPRLRRPAPIPSWRLHPRPPRLSPSSGDHAASPRERPAVPE